MFAIIDLETLGVYCTPVVLSAGLVFVNDAGVVEQEEYTAFALDEQLRGGRTTDENTLEFHAQHPAILARWGAVRSVDRRSFAAFVRSAETFTFPVWSWGADFDIGILREAGLFKRKGRCARTAWALLGTGKTRILAEKPHDPVSDCLAILANMRQLDPTLAMFHR